MSQVLERMASPVRSRLIGTLSGNAQQTPAWLLRLEDGEDEGLFAEDGAAWLVHSSVPTLVAGVRALLLQALHPGALAGVRDHSRYEEDPLGRLAGTIQWIHTVTFGSTSQALAGTQMVQSLHERWGRPIPGGVDGYVAEWAKAAELMNVADPPRTAAALRARIDEATDSGELRGGPEVAEIVRFIRRPPLSKMLRPSYRVIFRAAVSTLPRRHREMLGLPQRDLLPIHAATKLVLSGAEYLIGPKSAAEIVARRRLARLAESAEQA